MERILDEQAKELAAGGTGLAQDGQFHSAIAAAAHNQAITRVVHAIMDLLDAEPRGVAAHPGPAPALAQDHRRVLEAIRPRVTTTPREQAMRDHVIAVEGLVLGPEAMARQGARPVRATRRRRP